MTIRNNRGRSELSLSIQEATGWFFSLAHGQGVVVIGSLAKFDPVAHIDLHPDTHDGE
jgi:hypothetical protein